jgi:hypothetical protein
MVALLASPESYEGRAVALTGVLLFQRNSVLCLTKEHAAVGSIDHCVDVSFLGRTSPSTEGAEWAELRAWSGEYVTLEGTVEYKPGMVREVRLVETRWALVELPLGGGTPWTAPYRPPDRAEGATELIAAAVRCEKERLKALVDADGWDPLGQEAADALFEASLATCEPAVEALLGGGVDPSARTFDGSTALMAAVLGQDEDIVRLLLGRGADVNVVNESGSSALLLAYAENRVGIADLLFDAATGLEGKRTVIELAVEEEIARLTGWDVEGWTRVRLLRVVRSDASKRGSYQVYLHSSGSVAIDEHPGMVAVEYFECWPESPFGWHASAVTR